MLTNQLMEINMADVTGPISSMPGSMHVLPQGQMCDDHADRPAVARVQGETDSFGCEMYDMCQECLDAYNASMKEAQNQEETCDWCHTRTTGLRNRRDFEEGTSGRIYRVCVPCIKKENERLTQELEEDY